MPELSAIVLCYRAGHALGETVVALERELGEAGIDHELVLVANFDDPSDETPQVARSLASKWPDRVVVVAEPKAGGGMGADMRAGMDVAAGEHMVVIDGDSQNPVEDVVRTYRAMQETGAQVAKGRRVQRFDGLYRQALSFFYNALFRFVFKTRGLWDINGKPKGMSRSAYRQLRLRSDDWFLDAEIVLGARRAGMTIVEVPVVFRQNKERRSFVRPSAILEFLLNMARYRSRGGP